MCIVKVKKNQFYDHLKLQNENNIKLLENKVEINKQNIDDYKTNWFNIETTINDIMLHYFHVKV